MYRVSTQSIILITAMSENILPVAFLTRP